MNCIFIENPSATTQRVVCALIDRLFVDEPAPLIMSEDERISIAGLPLDQATALAGWLAAVIKDPVLFRPERNQMPCVVLPEHSLCRAGRSGRIGS